MLSIQNTEIFWSSSFYYNYFEFSSTGPAAEPSGRSSPPLLAGGGGGWGPPLSIGKQEVGTYIYSLLYTHTGLLGRLPYEVLQQLMWWRHRLPLGPMKEDSGAAFCSSPSPALGLRHRLCPTARHGRSTGRRA